MGVNTMFERELVIRDARENDTDKYSPEGGGEQKRDEWLNKSFNLGFFFF